MDEEGAVVAKPFWPFEPAMLRESVAQVRRWEALKAKGEAGDEVAAVDAALLSCQLGQVAYDDLEVDEESMSEAQLELYTQLGIDSEIDLLQTSMRRVGRDQEKAIILMNDLVAIYEAGQRPTRPELKYFFWSLLSQAAVNTGNAAMLEAAVADTKQTPGLAEMSRGLAEKLAAMRESGQEKGN